MLFIRLTRLTSQAARSVRNLDKIRAEARSIMEKNGGKMLSLHATLGRYDFIALFEAPDAKTAAKISALLAETGNFESETLPAIPIDEFIESLKK
ncbi:MAG: GYD domain-containing protein [Halobacteria archaeon]